MWKRDLSVSHDRVGNILRKQGDLTGALESYRLSMDIRRELARIDPSNTQSKRDLWVSNNKVAGALQANGDLAHALESYQTGLNIVRELIDIDADNAGWRSDYAISLDKMGDASSALKNFAAALDRYRASLDIRLALAAENVSNTVWQRSVWVSYMKIGGALEARGNRAEALHSYQDSLRVIEQLSAADVGNAGWATDELVSRWKIDVLSTDHNGGCEQRELLARGSELLKVLQRDQRLEPSQSSWIGLLENTLRSLEAKPCEGGRKASRDDVPSPVLVDDRTADDGPDSDVAGSRNSDAGCRGARLMLWECGDRHNE
jgi:tetratricopeptide (TPR) repeat protein